MQGLPLIGNLAELITDPIAFFVKGHATHGPAFRVKVPTRAYTVLAGYAANQFLIENDQKLLDHQPIYQTIARELGASHYPIATSGARHQHLRKAYRAAFSLDFLDRGAVGISAEIGRRAAGWGPGTTLPALDLLHDLLGDVVAPVLGGRPLGELRRDALTFGRFSMGCALGGYPSEFRYAPHYLAARRRVLPFYRNLIAWHHANPPGKGRAPGFVDAVLEIKDEDGEPLSAESTLGLVQMIYSNTLVYVAPACGFALYCFLANPQVRARAEAELDHAFGAGPISLAALGKCEYFVAAIKESMRLHPIGLAAPRLAKEPFEFAGYDFAVGDPLLIAVTAAHYLPELFPNPTRFEPERHLAPRLESKRPGAFVPFGLGGVACLAERMVLAMVQITVASLLRHSRLELAVPDYTLRKRINPFPEPAADLQFRVR